MNWKPVTDSGESDFVMGPPGTFTNQPSAAVIATRVAGSAYYYQCMSLPQGDYTLSIASAVSPSVHRPLEVRRLITDIRELKQER